MKSSSHITHRAQARFLLLAVGVLLVMQLLGVHAGWRIMLIGLGGTLIVGQIWIRMFSIEHDLRAEWAQVGDRIEARVTITNRSRNPALWAEVVDRSNLPTPPLSRSLNVAGGGKKRFLRELECTRRGVYTVGPMTLKTSDPFGLFELTIRDPELLSFVVFPQIVPIPEFDVSGAGPAGEGRSLRTVAQQTAISSSAREYQAGDQLRWIHWPTTVRRNSLYVRTFEGAPAGDWWIVLDVDERVQRGMGDESTLEIGVSLAASLADRGLKSGHAVGIAYADHRDPPQRRSWSIMRSLAIAESGPTSLKSVLLGLGSLARPASLLIVTPSGDPEWLDGLLPLIRKGHRPTVLLTNPEEHPEIGSRLAGLRARVRRLPYREQEVRL
jgi:uncharacterized protein (DUF58 family)